MSGGGSQTTASTPWGPASPYLTDIMQQAQKQYQTTNGQYANPAGNFNYGNATGAVGDAIGGTTPFGSMASSLAPNTTAAIQKQLSGVPDYTAVNGALDAANQQTWNSFNNQELPILNQNASFLGNPSGSIKDLNWATSQIGNNMNLNAQQAYLGEYDKAQAAQANAAGLGANIAQGAGSQSLQGANLYQSLAQMPQTNLADYAAIVSGTGGKFGTSTQQNQPGAGQTAANVIGGLTAGAGLANTLLGNGTAGSAVGSLTGGASSGGGVLGSLFGSAGPDVGLAGSAAGEAASGLGAGASAGMANTAADVAASNSAWLGGAGGSTAGAAGAGLGAAGAGSVLAGGAPALATVGTGAVDAASTAAAADAAAALGGSGSAGAAGAGAGLGAGAGAAAGVGLALLPLALGLSTPAVQLTQKYWDGMSKTLQNGPSDPNYKGAVLEALYTPKDQVPANIQQLVMQSGMTRPGQWGTAAAPDNTRGGGYAGATRSQRD